MAHIFKHPEGNNKGIIVFTQKEWRQFSGNKYKRRLIAMIPFLKESDSTDPVGFFDDAMRKVSQKYFIGVHFGGFQFRYQMDKIPFKGKYVDFVLSVESTLPNLDPNIHRIALNCRNFIPSTFQDNNREKIWDFVTVGRNVNFKCYPKLLRSIKKVLEIDPKATFLLVVPTQANMKSGEDNTILDTYYKLFSFEEQKQICLLYLHPELDVGISQNQLINFYNMSRVFMLFSTQIVTKYFTYGEGDSRVISEALCCGLPVVCSSTLKGGGRDYLTPENSVEFDDYELAHEALLSAREKFKDGIKDNPAQLTREDYSLPKLKEYFSQFYAKQGQDFNGELINTDYLDVRIPAHYSSVPWKLDPLQPTADVMSEAQFKVFMDSLDLS